MYVWKIMYIDEIIIRNGQERTLMPECKGRERRCPSQKGYNRRIVQAVFYDEMPVRDRLQSGIALKLVARNPPAKFGELLHVVPELVAVMGGVLRQPLHN